MYLGNLKSLNIEGLVLGCTHYPIMSKSLQKYFKNSIKIFHSGEALAYKYLKNSISNNKSSEVKIEYYVTDSPSRFVKYGNKFSFQKIDKVNLIRL